MSETAAPESTFISTNGCARCDGDGHPRLEFRPFTRPVTVGGIKLTHWALCPTTGEPILLLIEKRKAT